MKAKLFKIKDIITKSGRLKSNILYSDDLGVQKALYILYKETHFYKFYGLKERFYIYKNDMKVEDITCLKCSNSVKMDQYTFNKHCSVKCANYTRKEGLQKILSEHDIKNISQLSDHKSKVSKTWSLKSDNEIEKIVDMRKSTLVLKYGDLKTFEKIKHFKSKQTNFLRYKNDNFWDIDNNPSLKHLYNIIRWNDREFIISKFIDSNNQFECSKFCNFFNCCQPTAHLKMKKLNILYLKKSGGFDISKPSKLYYLRIKHDNKTYYKIGVTNFDVKTRFKQKKDYDKISILFEYSFQGLDAYKIEQKILLKYKQYIINDKILSSGNTEIFYVNIFKE